MNLTIKSISDVMKSQKAANLTLLKLWGVEVIKDQIARVYQDMGIKVIGIGQGIGFPGTDYYIEVIDTECNLVIKFPEIDLMGHIILNFDEIADDPEIIINTLCRRARRSAQNILRLT